MPVATGTVTVTVTNINDEPSGGSDSFTVDEDTTNNVLDVLANAARTLETEANAVTDNPLVLSDAFVSGGNFHAEPVGFAADIIALAVAEIGAIAQRRVALMVDPTLSHDLPPFLTANPGLNSGFMIAEVTTAALMSENKQMSHPASVDSTVCR